MTTKKSRKEVQFGVRFDVESSDKISQFADENDISKAAVIRKAVREFFRTATLCNSEGDKNV